MKKATLLITALAFAVPTSAAADAGTPASRQLAPATIQTGAVHALWQPKRRRPQPRPRTFDATGWTKLGEKWVTGRRDRDVFRVGRRAGSFTHLTVVVTDSDLEV
jgi:hypothetical protein